MKQNAARTLPIPWSTVRRISVEASVDPRTVVRFLRGMDTKALPTDRIKAAMAAMNIVVPGVPQ